MRRTLVCALALVALGSFPSCSLATPPSPDPGSQPKQVEQKSKESCAGGVFLLEQVCDANSAVANAVVGAVTGAPAKVAGAVAGSVFDQITQWMTDGARWVTKQIQSFLAATTTPELEAHWYKDRFAGMAALGIGLSALVAMIALASAALRRDPDALGATFIGMFRAGLGTGLVLALTVMALGVADGVSNAVAQDAAGQTASRFWGDVATAWEGGGGFGSAAIAFVFAFVQVIAGIAVWIELLLRQAGVYVAVLFMPAALAASIWAPLRAWQSRLARVLFVLIALKPVIVVTLSLAGSAAAAGGGPDKDLGVLLAAIMILVLAAFSPWVLMMLVSMDHEGSWAGGAAGGSMRGSLAGGASRVGGGLGRLGGKVAGRAALAGAGGGRLRGLGGGGSGRPGGGPAGGGGSPGGRGPAGGGSGGGGEPSGGPGAVRPVGAVAAAAGLMPPPVASSRAGGTPASSRASKATAAKPAPSGGAPAGRPVSPQASGPGGAPSRPATPRPGGPGAAGS